MPSARAYVFVLLVPEYGRTNMEAALDQWEKLFNGKTLFCKHLAQTYLCFGLQQ